MTSFGGALFNVPAQRFAYLSTVGVCAYSFAVIVVQPRWTNLMNQLETVFPPPPKEISPDSYV